MNSNTPDGKINTSWDLIVPCLVNNLLRLTWILQLEAGTNTTKVYAIEASAIVGTVWLRLPKGGRCSKSHTFAVRQMPCLILSIRSSWYITRAS